MKKNNFLPPVAKNTPQPEKELQKNDRSIKRIHVPMMMVLHDRVKAHLLTLPVKPVMSYWINQAILEKLERDSKSPTDDLVKLLEGGAR
jgi:hypothetical protein